MHPSSNPFPGLKNYDEKHSSNFNNRAHEIEDLLQKLREYQEAGHKIGDAIDNVERTNPAQTEGRVKDMVMDMEMALDIIHGFNKVCFNCYYHILSHFVAFVFFDHF